MQLVRLTIHDEDHEPVEVHESEIPVLRAQGLLREEALPEPAAGQAPKATTPATPPGGGGNDKEGE